ncbi:arylamine N-acetyltransferase family protein [Pseudonocardia sichuanensis]|uniref:N-hydroxyarylamine O-acetyltransferase n=1 Tax=Pseudonocardia kunmingensis TaxID=630975 RepID=A0A543E2K5_9PSEU|nr:arylamine N-acetyltransferase [Pseudonocardia kunmingensis]TQM15808.1 N-hydroxyarylamine O-acetyltransferase [Pseudonocardia kunmingensis]
MDGRMLLDRLGVDAPLRPDLPTLRRLHRAWRTRVPYENVDIQLGRPIELAPEALLDKFGRRGRGGFCYEMNGALALLLRSVGFAVDLVECGVLRADRGDAAWGNHVALLVTAGGEPWLADTGIGDAFLEPLPLRGGTHRQGSLHYRLERLDTTTWRVHHHPAGSVASYDLRTRPRALAEFAGRCHELATAPASPYVRVLVAQHHRDGRELALRSRVVAAAGSERTIASLEEFAEVLATFRIPVADLGADGVETLWERAGTQHAAWLEMRARSAR